MKPAVYEQRSALDGALASIPKAPDGSVALGALIGRLEVGSPTAKHTAARLTAFFESDGYERGVTPRELIAALLSQVEPAERKSTLDVRSNVELEPYLAGKKEVDAAAYTKLTGIAVSPAEAARLDALVKDVAKSMGLDHAVGFKTEMRYMDLLSPTAFLGTFEGWRRPDQPLLIGAGIKANTVDDIDILYRTQGGVPTPLRPMVEDLLKLDERQRIEAVLVHEDAELRAGQHGSSNPHRTAIDVAPTTSLKISPRVREHLALYQRLDQRLHGPPP